MAKKRTYKPKTKLFKKGGKALKAKGKKRSDGYANDGKL